ncbi:hypothetical protein JTE90_025474 [Oedothorax gibbosus]|uniref:ODAD1 central coiled coil region domain-containing protein n=1 Tax=Oedothorax gibbosus TaxID=931172 RepID=A0AAV6UZX0_9ARAC|nr:hypothetical protein JTE90_025474 [Oedothorax gibbosus]
MRTILHKYNQLLISNNALREDINSTLLTLNAFRNKYHNIKRLLAIDKKTLAEVVRSATVSYQTGESVKYKSKLIKERAEIEEKKLEEKIKELKILVEQDKLMKEFVEYKLKDRSSSSETEESSRNEQIMAEQLEERRGIMAQIQTASNFKEVGQICKEYVKGEEANLMLFEKVNELSLEIEKLGEEVREESALLQKVTEQCKEQNDKDLALKQGVENSTKKLSKDSQHLEDNINAETAEFEKVKVIMERIYTFLSNVSSQQVAFTIDKGITDDNVLQYLGSLEQRVTDLVLWKTFSSVPNQTLAKVK